MTDENDARTAWKEQVQSHIDHLKVLHDRYELVSIGLASVTAYTVTQSRANRLGDKMGFEGNAIRRMFDIEITPNVWDRNYADIDRLFGASLELGDLFFDGWKAAMDRLHATAGAEGWKLPENWEEAHEDDYHELRKTMRELQDTVVEAFGIIAPMDVIAGADTEEIHEAQKTLAFVMNSSKGSMEAQHSLLEFMEQLLEWDPVEARFHRRNPIAELLREVLGDDIVNRAEIISVDREVMRTLIKEGFSDEARAEVEQNG